MADIKYRNFATNRETLLDLGAFAALVKGAAITSLATADNYIEFGLSDSLNLRIDFGNNVTLIPTTNRGQTPPVRISIIDSEEVPTAVLVESRLHALRQIYAINFLIDAGHEDDLVKAFSAAAPLDLESLLGEEDKLLIKSASTGSFWLTLAAKSTAAWKSLTGIAPLFFEEGRQSVLERVRANTELAKLDVTKKSFDINLQRATALIDLYNKIEKMKDPAVKEKMKAELTRSIEATGNTLLALPAPNGDSTDPTRPEVTNGPKL
jgi:hypothetical protein